MTERERLIILLGEAKAMESSGIDCKVSDEYIADYLLENDVVRVVKCKDCKCCEHCYPAKAIGEEAIEGWYCKIRKKHMRPDDFCSYGERKGGAD